jgi:hypothetical protein
VTELTAPNASTVKAKLNVDAGCRIGIHAVRMLTKTGVSNLMTFTVGALPAVAEVEPNNEFSQPQPITLGVTVEGIVQTEDVDYFVVELKKGERINCELEGLRLGNGEFDPYLAILNEARFELARSDDAPLLYQDCLCSLVAPEDGKYILQVRETAFGGNGNSKYRLHVGRYPRPHVVMPAGGRPGETIEVTCIGDAGGPFKTKVTIPADAREKYELFVEDAGGIAPSPNVLRVADIDNFLEVEPNDDRATASSAAAPGAFNGIIDKPGDVDHFKFTAKKGERYDIRVYARQPLRSPLDSVITVFRANGGGAGNNDDQGGPDSALQFNAPADEEYTIQIRDHLNAGGPRYAYRIEVVPAQPKLTLIIPERQRYVSETLTVPSGNRMAMMVNAQRNGIGGDLAISAEGLPQGLSAQPAVMQANRSEVPVLFTAAAGAPVGGELVDLVGRATDEKLNVVGHVDQRTMLVRGQGNSDVWGHNADRIAVSLSEEAPFTIDIVQPKVPIVRDGSMDLKVVAQRKEGFTAPISLRLLYNPPGIGSSTSINIAEGQTEAVVPLTANGGAAIQMWPIVVTGTAAFGNGRVEAATNFAELEIADRFFDLAIQKSAVEQNQEGVVVVSVSKKIDFPETGEVELLGLPAGTSVVSEKPKFTQDSTELTFRVKASEDARPNTYKSLVCRTVIIRDGEPITTTFGGGELRVDKPLPPKVAAAPAKPAPNTPAKPAEAKPAAAKPLSRLEQLRLEKARQLEEK